MGPARLDSPDQCRRDADVGGRPVDMPALDASSLREDTAGLAFLRDVLRPSRDPRPGPTHGPSGREEPASANAFARSREIRQPLGSRSRELLHVRRSRDCRSPGLTRDRFHRTRKRLRDDGLGSHQQGICRTFVPFSSSFPAVAVSLSAIALAQAHAEPARAKSDRCARRF